MRPGRLVLLLAGCLLALAARAVPSDAERGRALYEGREPLPLAGDPAARAQACVSCHRPSGLGGFEGGLAVPPIAGPQLFQPLDRDTARYFAHGAAFRVRPAYDEVGLAHLLRTGVTPDGVTLHTAMPRVQIDDADVTRLAAYLRGLSATPPPGLDSHDIYLATVTTPDADPRRREAMVETLRRFVEQKNGQSRLEAQRSRQAGRTREMAMYTKFRVWHLDHWALEGPPSAWAAQLAQRQAARPVFAMVAGLGRGEWAPVAAFCESQRMPCLLPLVDAGPPDDAAGAAYNLYFHAGIDADARLAARTLQAQGLRRAAIWDDDAAPSLGARVAAVLRREGIDVEAASAAGERPPTAIVSVLDPAAMAARLQSPGAAGAPVVWLAGSHALGQADLDAVLRSAWHGWVVTPMRTGAGLDRHLERTRLWLRQQGLQALPADVAGSALQAATVLGEGLMHMDFGFTREYLLELLEHGLENVIAWSPYPRLSIGPGQRIAVKQSQLGVVDAGRVDWRAEPLR